MLPAGPRARPSASLPGRTASTRSSSRRGGGTGGNAAQLTGTAGVTEADARLHRLLGGEPVAWLVRRARDRLEAGRPLTGTVTLPAATAEQRRAVERLTGRAARSGASLSVSLAEVDRILRDSGAAPGGLAEAVTRLTGPLRDRNRERAVPGGGLECRVRVAGRRRGWP